MKAIEIIETIICSLIIFLIILLAAISTTYAQNTKSVKSVEERKIVARDTILATDYVKVKEYIDKNGKSSYKASWCGKLINISSKYANDILEGSDAYVVVCRYNNGEVIRNKVICLYR